MSTENTKLACLQSVKRKNGKRPEPKNTWKVVDLAAYVDRSGSVGSLSNVGWEGLPLLVKEQKLLLSKDKTLKIFFTLVTFDGYATKYYQQIDVNKIPDNLSKQELARMFNPRGSTKLVDTVYSGVVQQNTRIAALGKKYGEENVSGVLIIWTDGDDNMSTNCTEAMLHQLITDTQKKPRRTILFTAANQDAIKTGARFGVQASHCLTTQATPGAAPAMYRACSAATARACSGASGAFTRRERTTNAAAVSAPPASLNRAPFQSPLPTGTPQQWCPGSHHAPPLMRQFAHGGAAGRGSTAPFPTAHTNLARAAVTRQAFLAAGATFPPPPPPRPFPPPPPPGTGT